MLITTLYDIKQEVEIVGLVSWSTKFGTLKGIDFSIEKKITEKAEKLNADAVIGLRVEFGFSNIIAYGTAIKFKK